MQPNSVAVWLALRHQEQTRQAVEGMAQDGARPAKAHRHRFLHRSHH